LSDPLELLPHVQFADTLDAAYLGVKLQARTVRPLDLQLVIDYLPKLMVHGRPELARKLGQKPQPKIYLHLRNEDLTSAEAFLEQAAATYLILLNNGRLVSKAELLVQVEEVLKAHKEPIAGKSFSALEQIARAKEGIVE
jgi:hypothetical protein